MKLEVRIKGSEPHGAPSRGMLATSTVMIPRVGCHIHLKINSKIIRKCSPLAPRWPAQQCQAPHSEARWEAGSQAARLLARLPPDCLHSPAGKNLILLSQTQSYLSWHCGPDFDIAPVFHCKVGGSRPDILCLNLAGGDSSIGVLLCLDPDLTTVGVLTH